MNLYRFFIPCLLFTAMLVLTAERSVYAQGAPGVFVDLFEHILDVNPVSGGTEYYRVDIKQTPYHYLGIGVPLYAGVLFSNCENCGNADHRTKYDDNGLLNSNSTSRYFKHVHVCYDYQIHGIDQYGNLRLVTEANVEAFWHDYFTANRPNWTYHGGVNPKVNCWGYAFGYSTWVEDPNLIYNNDYPEFSYVFDMEAGHLIEQPSHVIKVTEVAPYPVGAPYWNPGQKIVTQTQERFRSSGMYEVSWSYFNQLASCFRKKK